MMNRNGDESVGNGVGHGEGGVELLMTCVDLLPMDRSGVVDARIDVGLLEDLPEVFRFVRQKAVLVPCVFCRRTNRWDNKSWKPIKSLGVQSSNGSAAGQPSFQAFQLNPPNGCGYL